MTGPLAWLGLLLACRPLPSTLEVLHGGCEEVQDGAACALTADQPLRLWLRHEGPVSLRLDDRRVDATAVELDGGTRFVLPVPERPAELTVEATQSGVRQRWALSIVSQGQPAWREEIAELSPTDCQSTLAEEVASAQASQRGDLYWSLAGCDLRAGDRSAGLSHMSDAATAFAASGQLFSAIRARCALSSMLFGEPGQLGRIRELLADFPPTTNGELQWGIAYHRGLLAQRTGDLRQALALLDDAATAAHRLGLSDRRDDAEDQRASIFSELGRFDEAETLQRALIQRLPDPEAPCEHSRVTASRLGALAWYLLARAEAEGGFSGEEPTPLLQRTLELQQTCGHAARDLANTRVNLALAAWTRGELELASTHLDAAEAVQSGGDPVYAAWLADLRGRVALARGELDAALTASEQALELARLRGAPDVLVLAHLGRAEVWRARGELDSAVEAYAAAHEVLWQSTALVPLGAGRGRLLAARRRGTERFVGLLLERNQAGEAFRVLRLARSRVLRTAQITERIGSLSPPERAAWDAAMTRYAERRAEQEELAAQSWQLSATELETQAPRVDALAVAARSALDDALLIAYDSAPTDTVRPIEAGEILFAWLPVEGAWHGLAATEHGVTTARVGLLPGDLSELGAALFGPFAEQLATAELITLLPWGELRELDLHALEVDGEKLIAFAPVRYSLDLAAAPLGQRERPDARTRLVVADPRGDLPLAREEGQAVPGAAQRLVGSQATREAVRAALARADAFHFAGHAVVDPDDALGARLLLADGDLHVGDLLALSAAPREVVLSACESAAAPSGLVETWGLAQAFLTAGAAEVIATRRPIADRSGAALSAALYAQDPALPLATRLQRALVGLSADGHEDWATYRVWVR